MDEKNIEEPAIKQWDRINGQDAGVPKKDHYIQLR
jgi:hypothetical protein